MPLPRTQFENQLYETWGQHYSLPTERFLKSGTHLIKWESLKNTQYIVQETIGKLSILRCDAVLLDSLQVLCHTLGEQTAMTYEDCLSAWDAQKLEHDSRGDYCYLYADDFSPCQLDDFLLRKLSLDDTPALDLMKSACSEDDIDEGEVNTDDELVFGIFDGDKLVACASMYDWHGFADIGVLVHPDYRGRKLGKAAVSTVCDQLLTSERLISYRYDILNTHSKRIAHSLGFTHYFTAESFKVVN